MGARWATASKLSEFNQVKEYSTIGFNPPRGRGVDLCHPERAWAATAGRLKFDEEYV